MAKQVITDEELHKYPCKSDQLSFDLSSASRKRYTNKVTMIY